MKATITRTALALASLLVGLGHAQAQELSYSELEARLAKLESQIANQNGLQQAGYCGDACGNGGCGVGCCDACSGAGYGDGCGCCGGGCCDPCCGGYYTEVQLSFLRAHMPEDVTGKLEETYKLAPRFILGYENGVGQGARIRYWLYDHSTGIENDNDAIVWDLNIIDLEITQRFQGVRSDVVFSGGVRGGEISSIDDDDDKVETRNLLGLTVAADLRSLITANYNRELAWVGGVRLSILGGDWVGNNGHDFIEVQRDDNFFVSEIYAGVEYSVAVNGYQWYTRLAYEIQNWDSDSFDGGDNDFDSLGFVGPQWTLGLAF